MAIIILWAILIYYSLKQEYLDYQIDQKNITPSDFAIYLYGIPEEYLERDDLDLAIKQFFSPLKIDEVVPLFKMGSLMTLHAKYQSALENERIRRLIKESQDDKDYGSNQYLHD